MPRHTSKISDDFIEYQPARYRMLSSRIARYAIEDCNRGVKVP